MKRDPKIIIAVILLIIASSFGILRHQWRKQETVSQINQMISDGNTTPLSKPSIELYVGKIEGKQVQLFVESDYFSSGTFSQSLWGNIYIQPNMYYLLFSNNKKNSNSKVWKAHIQAEGKENTSYELIYDAQLREVVVSDEGSGKRYKLTPGPVSFVAYEEYRKESRDCQAVLGKEVFINHYKFTFEIESGTSHFQHLYETLRQPEARTWEHKVYGTTFSQAQAVDSTLTEEDYCKRLNHSTMRFPIYLDSTIAVVKDYVLLYFESDMSYEVSYEVYDVSSGKRILLKDLLNTSNPRFVALNRRKMKEVYQLINKPLDNIHKIMPSEKYYMDPSGIRIIYEEGPIYYPNSKYGNIFVDYTFEELKPFMKRSVY